MKPIGEPQIQMLPHILYEIEMLLNLPSVRGTNLVEYAILESRLIHARNLKNFFEAARRKFPDDVIPSDFGFDAKSVGLSKKIIKRLNKALAHISYSRLKQTPETQKWTYADFINPIKSRCIEFTRFLITNYKDQISESDFSRLENLLSQ